MNKILSALLLIVSTSGAAAAAPYTFTAKDYIEYGIYFAARGNQKGYKLLDLRVGDIKGYYARFNPPLKQVPSTKQALRLKTSRGSIRIVRNDNEGLTVTRDTWNESKRVGTKRLEVRFERAICTDATGLATPCVVDLLLTTDAPDRGVVRQPRTLTITTSTGLSFRYRTIRQDGGKPLDRAALRRSPAVVNYAWEWRGGR